jgi:putative transposase
VILPGSDQLGWFRSRAEAKVVIETWRCHSNHVCPHLSLKDPTSIEFKAHYDSANQGAVLWLGSSGDPWAGEAKTGHPASGFRAWPS